MKKLFCFAMAVCLLLGLFAGCDTGTSNESSYPVITDDGDNPTGNQNRPSKTSRRTTRTTRTKTKKTTKSTTAKKTEKPNSTDSRTQVTTEGRNNDVTTVTTTKKPTTTTKAAVTTNTALLNTKYLLTQKKKLTVGYIGGSITDGSGVSNKNLYSWRALTNAWLRETYPDAAITDINAAVGATGSYYGKCRIDKDLISKNPDLVFIEFVVNDQIERTTFNQSYANVETMVRKCLTANPNMDIVLVYTTTVALGGNSNTWTDAFDKLAADYGLEVINTGAALKRSGQDLNNLFSLSDKIHPNKKGYAIMAQEVQTRLTALLKEAGAPKALKKHTLRSAVTANLNTNTKTYTAANIKAQNPSLSYGKTVPVWCTHDNIALKQGDKLTFKVRAESIGMYWFAEDTTSSQLTVSLDGGVKKYTATLNINGNCIIREMFSGLDKTKEHTITFTYNGKATLHIPFIFVTA